MPTSQTPRKSRYKKDGWYLQRTYPHFDRPLPFDAAKAYVADPGKVAAHSFYPLISYEIRSRRYRGHDDRRTKIRPIKYPAHVDGYIYSYYCHILSQLYERRVAELGVDANVIAYRPGRGLSNIDYAKQGFDAVRVRESCAALAFDISGFFDNIDHKNLEEQWRALLGVSSLPRDHLAVYRSLTRYAEVDRRICYSRLGIIDERKAPRPLCGSAKDFRSIIKGKGSAYASLIQVRAEEYGIPQGTPLSALLSNIYMLPFDVAMRRLEKKISGYYRRYSDDILWVCDENELAVVKEAVKIALQERGDRLTLKDEKTETSIFSRTKQGRIVADRPLQYLGFTFDGSRSLLRSQTLARFWRRLLYATRAAKRRARVKGSSGQNKVFRKKLNSDLTHLGKENFVTAYAYRAQGKLGGKGIRRQLAGHKERIDRELARR